MRICPQCEELTEAEACPHDGFSTVFYTSQMRLTDVDPMLGKVFEERYRIEEVLGRGGFGAVYKATQLAVNRPVAIKVLRADLSKDLKEVARFQQEARAVAAIRHPGIVEFYDCGQAHGGELYLAMEMLQGRPLDAILKEEGALEPARVVSLARQALDALGEAHKVGVVHRDLKPENLFIAREGRREDVVKLLDFGIAKVTGDASAGVTLTKTGFAMGSPRYMSPEQCQGQRVSPQSDLYSFGCILFEMLFARPAFVRPNATAYLVAHVHEAPELPVREGLVPQGPLVSLIFHCMAKDPDRRPRSAEDVEARLARITDPSLTWTAPGSATVTGQMVLGDAPAGLATGAVALDDGSSPPPDPTPKPVWGVVAAVAAAAMLVAGAALWLFTGGGTEGPRVDDAPVSASKPAQDVPPPAAEADAAAADAVAVRAVAADPTPASPPLVATIISAPSGATLTVGGEAIGAAPKQLQWPAGGAPPVVTLELPGHEPLEVALQKADAGQARTVTLTPLAKAPPAPIRRPKRSTRERAKQPTDTPTAAPRPTAPAKKKPAAAKKRSRFEFME